MPDYLYFYFDANGQKQGPPRTVQQLQTLVDQGIVTQTTPMETNTGHKGVAGQITGLKFNTAPPPLPHASEPSQGMSTEARWLIILGIVLGALCFLKWIGLVSWIVFVPTAIITLIVIAVLFDKKEDKELDRLIEQGNTQAMRKRAGKYQEYEQWNEAKQLFRQLVDQEYPDAQKALDRCLRAEYWANYQCRFKNIFEAAKEGTVDDIGFFVERKKAKVNAKNNNGWTPLHYAVHSNSNVEVLEYLVSRGASVNTQVFAANGIQTPLDLADTEEKKSILREAGGQPATSLSAEEKTLPPPSIGRIRPADYIVYLRVLEALRNNGYYTYEVEKSSFKEVSVGRNGHTYGWVFVLADPTPGLASCIIGAFSEDFRTMRNSFTQHSTMQGAIEITSKRFKRKAHRIFPDYDEDKHFIGVYWPEGSNVGAYTNDPNNEYDVHEWLPIVQEAIGS